MKKLLSIIIITFFAVATTSCNNDNDDASPATPAPTTGDGFRWTDSSSSTEQTVNNPYASDTYNSIFATNTGGGTVFEINLTSIDVGTYSLTVSGNALFYQSSTMPSSFSPTSGSVIITTNANNKLSGTFTATGTGGGVTAVSGSFTNIAINN